MCLVLIDWGYIVFSTCIYFTCCCVTLLQFAKVVSWNTFRAANVVHSVVWRFMRHSHFLTSRQTVWCKILSSSWCLVFMRVSSYFTCHLWLCSSSSFDSYIFECEIFHSGFMIIWTNEMNVLINPTASICHSTYTSRAQNQPTASHFYYTGEITAFVWPYYPCQPISGP